MKNNNINPKIRSYHEYVSDLKMSRDPRIIVEGKDDKIFFTQLRDFFHKANPKEVTLNDIAIDSVENMSDFDKQIIGNRMRVIYIIHQLKRERNAIGFVDREFDGFEIHNDQIIDNYPFHRNQNRIVFSRGHSTENYVHEKQTIINSLWHICPNEKDEEIRMILENSYDDLIVSTCTVSLCGKDLHCLKELEDRIFNLDSVGIMEFQNNKIFLKFSEFQKLVSQKCRNINMIDFSNRYNYYLKVAGNTPIEILRWACHGHIIELLFSLACLKCLRVILEGDLRYPLNEDQRFLTKIREWLATEFPKTPNDIPIEIFSELGVNI